MLWVVFGSSPFAFASPKISPLWYGDQHLGGLPAPLSFTPGKPAVDNCYYEYTIRDRKFAEMQGMVPQCAPDSVISAMVSQLKD